MVECGNLHSASIVVQSVSVTTLLVCVHIDAAVLVCGFKNQSYSLVELMQIVVAATGVAKQFDSIQSHLDMRRPTRVRFWKPWNEGLVLTGE